MKFSRALTFAAAMFCACEARAFDLDEAFDRLDAALTFATPDGTARVRLSGTLDLEGYFFSDEPTGLIDTKSDALFNPRLTLYLDAQAGPHVYAFAQARADRGFDPGDHDARVELDEYAVRITPSAGGEINLQVGRFGTVAGNWLHRHLSWENPFINAPLPYDQFTVASDTDPPLTVVKNPYYHQAPRYERLPIIWGPSYATGAAVFGRLGIFDYAAEIKNASLSSRPDVWNALETGFNNPTFTGRVGVRPNEAWAFGASASDGTYLREHAEYVPPTASFSDYHETVFGQDVSFAWHHLQLWAEVFEARFELPYIGNADVLSYYVEAKYKFAPQFYAAVRWNQQFYGTVTDTTGVRTAWDDDRSRIDVAATYRFTSHTQLKLQYTANIPSSSDSSTSHTFAAQFTVRF